jgi:hypothetical protein
MASELKVDTISEKTTSSGVTIDGVLIKDSAINASSVSGINRKNYLINGNFDIWQRGTSVTGGYGADRWRLDLSGATGTFAQGTFTVGQTDVPNNPKFYGDITITGADDNARIEQKVEDVNTLAGETITISFWAKYTTNAPTNFVVQIAQVFGSGGSSTVNTTFATGQTLTTSWQKFTATGTVPSISGKTVGGGSSLTIRPLHNSNNETFDYQIAQVQVEKGSVATDFEVRHIGEELHLCQRYYHNSGSGIKYHNGGAYFGTTTAKNWYILPTTMRTNPTVTFAGSGSDYTVLVGGYVITGTAIGSSSISPNGFMIDLTTAAQTNGAATVFRWTANGKIEADAEL